MKARRRGGIPGVPAEDPDFSRALEAMTAPELRAFVRGVLGDLDPDAQAAIVDALIARAVKGCAGWKPGRPAQRIVDDAKSFAEAARVVGYADPADVSEHLRLGGKAFLAGDHATARGVFEALLLPIAVADIDLGEHELVDEVLTVDTHTCVAQYVTSVYTTTPVSQRADAVLRAMEQVGGISSLLNPIEEMEDVSAGTLPDLGAFLPLWAKRLGRFRPAKRTNGRPTTSAGFARLSFVWTVSLASNGSLGRRNARKPVWPGARRSRIAGAGLMPSAPTTRRRRWWARHTGEGRSSTGPRSPPSSSGGPTCRDVWKPRGVALPLSRACCAGWPRTANRPPHCERRRRRR